MYGYEIGAAPASLSGTGVLARVVDGLAFRYYWATEGLRPEDHEFRPGPDSMSTKELQQHIVNLVSLIQQTVFNASERERFTSDDAHALREKALENLRLVRERLEQLTDDAIAEHQVRIRESRFPVWNIMNGPLADALTHVGQINAWRRLNGNPTPRADVFLGVPRR